jgi:hypothetical protein
MCIHNTHTQTIVQLTVFWLVGTCILSKFAATSEHRPFVFNFFVC